MTDTPVSAVMLAYGAEPYLREAVDAVLASAGVAVELVLVDNGAFPESLAQITQDPRITVVTPGTNLGFAGGMNLAVGRTSHPVVVLVNSDALVDQDALAVLARRLENPEVGIAGATILIADEPETLNSAGNPLHVLGLSWAGDMGRPASEVSSVREVASASGACMALRREH